MVKTSLIFLYLQAFLAGVYAQSVPPDSVEINRKRLLIVSSANALFFTGAFIALDKAWYSDYERGRFHFFDDNPEWNQMDKAGHVWTTYQVTRASAEAWKWTGVKRNTSALLGAATGMLYQSIIEIQDGFSDQWGFSWGDMGTNILGAGIFVAQDMAWKEQRIQVKMNYWPEKYPAELIGRRNELYGKSMAERILKDYNSQTYWISANIKSFLPASKAPAWLNISLGYGAEGLLGGRTNKWTDDEGVEFNYTAIPRERKYYLSADIDLTKIKTQSRFLRSVFFAFNAIKVPAPALEMNNKRKFRLVIK